MARKVVYRGVLFIRGVPEEVKEDFKAMCVRRGISMTKMITRMIKNAVRQDGEK